MGQLGNITILKPSATGIFDVENGTQRCYLVRVTNIHSIWHGENPLTDLIPFFILQLCIINVCSRLLILLLRRFHQPHFVAQILAGILTSPTILGRSTKNGVDNYIYHMLYPSNSMKVLETIGNLGIVFYMFFIGLQIDLTMTVHDKKKATSFALAGLFLPFCIGIALLYVFRANLPGNDSALGFLIWGGALSVTSFPVLTRLLADIKILQTSIGRTTFSSAFLSNFGSWLLLVIVSVLSANQSSKRQAWSFLALTIFILVCVFFVNPIIMHINSKIPEGERISETHISTLLCFVLVCGFATDAMGLHSLTGAFVFGLVMPQGELGNAVADRFEDLVSGILLPLYFTITGLRVNLDEVFIKGVYGVRFMVIVVATVAKIGSALVVAYFQNMTLKEGTAVGVLMNTKDVLAIVILNIGVDRKIISQTEFSVMVMALLIMSIMVSPIVSALYKPANRFMHYKRRTVQDTSSSKSELQIIACIHETSHVSGIINLLEASNATLKSPITVHALHLVEFSDRTSSSMLIIHTTRKSGVHNISRAKAQSDLIINALERYEQDTLDEMTVLPLTAMSPYRTMNEDIVSLAVDKRVAIIIVPFHKTKTGEGKLEETTNTEIRMLNKNLLDTAPCSVAIFVDRGFGAMPRMELVKKSTRRVAMIYVGGPDDREALCYAWRMAGHPNIILHIIRLVHYNKNAMSSITDEDNEFMHQFKHSMTSSTSSTTYTEKMSDTGEETVKILSEMDHNYDLYIVGRGAEVQTPITDGLLDWSDCPELGPIGDILVSSDFAVQGSVLVVQQYKADSEMSEQEENCFEEYKLRMWLDGVERINDPESPFLCSGS